MFKLKNTIIGKIYIILIIGAMFTPLSPVVSPLYSQDFPESAGTDSDPFKTEQSRILKLAVSSPDQSRILKLAVSSPDYPVTPGDVYNLTYVHGEAPITLPVVVESDYSINLSIFGIIDGRGLIFPELKKNIEERVSASYPRSTPRLIIHEPGFFRVTLTGEVWQTALAEVNGLTQLDDAVRPHLTGYSSIRDVRVISASGVSRSYDLYKARRAGDLTQNPYLRPGDRIVLRKADRTITLSGEVKRPGTYQLLPGEQLSTLLETYGDGMTAAADLERVRIVRVPPEAGATSFYLDVNLLDRIPGLIDAAGSGTSASGTSAAGTSASGRGFDLQDLDTVTVRTKDTYLPVVFFEGAVLGSEVSEPNAGGASQAGFARYPYRFRPGAMLSDAVESVSGRFLPAADLAEAYIHRAMEFDGEILPVNLEELQYRRDPPGDVELKPGDRIFVPFRQRFVIVSGAVQSPGRFPYVPGRTFEYYLHQAGGADRSRHYGMKPVITDITNTRKTPDKTILPEDRIHFGTNNPWHYILPFASVVSTITTTVLLLFR